MVVSSAVARRATYAVSTMMLLVVCSTSPAHAFGRSGPAPTGGAGGGGGTVTGGGPTGGTGSGSSTGTGGSAPVGDSGGSHSGTVGNCHVVSSPSFLGLSCGTVNGGGNTQTIKQMLGSDPLPGCWNEPMTDQEKAALGVQDTPGAQGSTWWWVKCLTGIDPKTLAVQPGGAKISWGYNSYLTNPGPGDPKVVRLTANQQKLVDSQARVGSIPTPVAAVSPSGVPVVGQQVAFFDGTPGEVTRDLGGVSLRALVTKVTVDPMGDGNSVSCPGTGVRAASTDTPASKPGACWYQYTKSSAREQDQKFAGSITAHWEVSVSTDGGAHWQPFNAFDKTALTNQQVNEIQALNVS